MNLSKNSNKAQQTPEKKNKTQSLAIQKYSSSSSDYSQEDEEYITNIESMYH